MDDEKSITEKFANAISKATDTVKSTLSNMVDTASEAAELSMQSNAEKMSGRPATAADPEQIAGTTNEQIYIPEASDAVAMPPPLLAARPVPENKRKASTGVTGGKTLPTPTKAAAKRSKKTAARRTAKKPAPKAGRKSKSAKSGAKKSVRKAAKKSAWQATKKSKR